MRFLNETRIVIPLLVVILILLSYGLYRNITHRVKPGENPIVGVLTYKTRIIQRKFDGEVVWENIPSQTPIRNRDTIRTESDSDAILTLEDGTQIEIGEKSMILVDFSDKKYNLNFSYGTFNAKKSSSESDISIQAGESSVSLTSGELSLNKLGDSVDIKVSEGNAKLKIGDEEKSLQKNQIAKISEDAIDIQTQSIKILNPKDRSRLLADGKFLTVVFEWSYPEKEPINLRLNIARDIGFRRIFLNEVVSRTSYSAKLPSGTYYWRLEYKDASGKELQTGIQRFTILDNSPMEVFTPAQSSVVAIHPNVPKPVVFSWKNLESADRYRLEISSDPEFQSLLVSKETSLSSLGVPGLKEGLYFFRVSGISNIPGAKENTSETRNFRIVYQTSKEPPILLEPADSKSFSILSIPENGIFFSCKDRLEFNGYTFQISKEKNFQTLLQDFSSDVSYFRWKPDGDSGVFYWRVVTRLPDGETVISKVHSFTITDKVEFVLLKPANGVRIEYPDGGNLDFSWRPPLPVNGKSRLLLSQGAGFSEILQEVVVSGSGATIQIPKPGEYFWKLVWEKYESSVQRFTLFQPIGSPKILFPPSGSEIDMTTRNELLLEWTQIREVSGYKVRLLDITGLREREVFSTTTEATSLRFKDLTKLSQGRFRLEVKAFARSIDGMVAESKPERSDFLITLKSGLSTKILTPEKIYVE